MTISKTKTLSIIYIGIMRGRAVVVFKRGKTRKMRWEKRLPCLINEYSVYEEGWNASDRKKDKSMCDKYICINMYVSENHLICDHILYLIYYWIY